ncbi:MAG: type I glutamate--ammonia ligase [Pseudomonadales bacterium]|jgi:glutamine synthetase|nr:type I glutamate--ammonia ligase [Pseudomonadales bacterium]MCP5338146.1 type I glutamate--ammonia ligase [Pseudomonadales bacterium]
MSRQTLQLINDHDAKWVDIRFTDTRGKEQHVTFPASAIGEDTFETGVMFDGSSIAGWKGIEASDMILLPQDETSYLDPFYENPTVVVTCNIIEPTTMQTYERDPRSIATRAEAYLRSCGIADTCYVGPEPEFFVFDGVKWRSEMGGQSYSIHSAEAAWDTNSDQAGEWASPGHGGHRPTVKGGYFPVPPVDSLHEIRAEMCNTLQAIGLEVELHHHEVANAGQCEIGVKFNTLTRKADEIQQLKYVVHNVAAAYGKTATFMPKPLVGDNGSGMHCHFSLWKEGKNLFAGDGYAGLSETALYFIGGIIRHAKALNAFTNPTTNSYKRLVPGYEAPVMLAYSSRNRSAAIRIPYTTSPKARRIEARFPDPGANPYLAFAALMMAGIDGIQNRQHPGEPASKDLYHLPPEEAVNIPTICHSLEMAINELRKDHAFLTRGNVFTPEMIEAYIELKMNDVQRLRMTPHPVEFEMYYSC